jgi:hypothetical protein
MLTIPKNIFLSNLRLTQQYCQDQLDNEQVDNATALRSINPVFNDVNIFTFQIAYFDSSIHTTKWSIDPFETNTDYLINGLFEEQLKVKQKLIFGGTNQIFEGDILVSKIDCTVIDGASEVQSLGFIDTYDIPPIDTWFYLTKVKEGRLLFSWVPQKFKHDANEGILVNCVDCFNWFKTWYPNVYHSITTEK